MKCKVIIELTGDLGEPLIIGGLERDVSAGTTADLEANAGRLASQTVFVAFRELEKKLNELPHI